jgi:hypothetical protein
MGHAVHAAFAARRAGARTPGASDSLQGVSKTLGVTYDLHLFERPRL